MDPAGAIAAAGVSGSDDLARQALSIFYDCLGRFCQLMALGFQAFGGVFLGGSSTARNRDYLIDSPFMTAFLDNPTQQALLGRFPVYLVKVDDLNLDGALWLAGSKRRGV